MFDWGHKHNETDASHNSWTFPNPFEGWKEYAHWGRITFVDSNGAPVETAIESTQSNETNPVFKWYEEKTQKYIAYEAAAKKFMPEDDYANKGKCPVMSLLTSESQVDAKAEEPQDPTSPFYVEEPESKGIPTAMFHGFGDFCLQPGDIQFNEMLHRGTGGPVKCIEVGWPMVGSIINNFEEIAQKSCQKIAADKTFAGEFNVVGLSQGGLLARYIAEECDMPGKVRNIATLGGPHMGVAAVPHCFEGAMCDIVNTVAKKLVYTDLAQDWIAPAGYFRDVNDWNAYVKDSVFLPALNNEHTTSQYAALRKESFGSINAGLFGMFTEDTMIYPKETAWFQGLDKHGQVVKLEDSDFYKEDYIGVKSLNEAGKITWSKIEGDHLQFTTEYIKDTLIPFLKK
jgi:palmitoyl-protein thioesterase